MEVPAITTTRLRLRGWLEGDVERMAAIYADPDVVRYLRPLDLEGTRTQLQGFELQWERRGFGIWAIEERASGRLIGRAGLWHHEDWSASPHDGEVGWTLARSSWGQGLATEAGAAALRFGFETIGMERVVSIAHRENVASQRVMQKLGMLREGETVWRETPVVWYGLDRAGWEPPEP